jgi:predicted DNA-binding transcriptional regulator YafY
MVVADLPRLLGEAVRTQVLDASADGRGWLDLEVAFDSIHEARTALLGLGASVEVVSPDELRAEMARAAREVADLYVGQPA